MKRKIISIALSAALVFTSTGIVSFAASSGSGSSSSSSDLDKIAEAADSSDSSDSSSDNKETTVYVISDANGEQQNIIVDSWLKNPGEADSLNDKTDLSNIENTKGNEKYTENNDGTITWNAKGNDIYYEGTSSDELPVDVNIGYELDGKKVEGKDIKNATGHLKISFTYKNNTGKTEKINGKSATIYQPYAMISGTVFENSNVKNLKIKNGKIINDGTRSIAVGLALPGLAQSLDIESAGLPESITIEGDVKDFDLMGTLTLGTSDALKKLDLNDISSVDELSKKMDELQSASTKLVSGSKELANGTVSASNGTNQLVNGINTLANGAYSLDNGAGSLANGTSQLASGASQLQNGADQLANGLTTVKSSLDSADLEGNTAKMLTGLQQISSAIKGSDTSLYAGATGIQAGAEKLYSSLNGRLVSGADEISSGGKSLASNAEKSRAELQRSHQDFQALSLEQVRWPLEPREQYRR